ncbi:MAG: hypothetical protein AAGB10_02980 [Pseudomonadota bacterium]
MQGSDSTNLAVGLTDAVPGQIDRRKRGIANGGSDAPVDRYYPASDQAAPLTQVLLHIVPELQSTVRILRNLPQWVADTSPRTQPGLPESESPLTAIRSHANRLDLGLAALASYALLEDHVPSTAPVDLAGMVSDVAARKLALRPAGVNIQVELPTLHTDPVLVRNIVFGLLETALVEARREKDGISFKAISAKGLARLSVIYAGPTLDLSAVMNLGRGAPVNVTPTTLSLANVWRATAMLGGEIEIGAGFLGDGARITVIVPQG